MMSQVVKPKDETFARNVFDSFLQEMYEDSPIRWEPSETPDYYVEIDKVRFGLEITQVMDEVVWDDRTVSSKSAESTLQRLTAKLDARSKELGVLSGSYVLSSNIDKDPASIAAHVEDVALGYIRKTQHLGSAPLERIRLEGAKSWWIQKMASPTKNRVWYTLHLRQKSELAHVVSASIEKKKQKLRALNIPLILLLIDAYRFANDSTWEGTAEEVCLGGFHTIARVTGGGRLHMLHSEESEWKAAHRLNGSRRPESA